MLTKPDVRKLIAVYMKAWKTQDPDLIVTIFTPDATYHERVMEDITITGHDGIRAYWETKVVGAQANIICGMERLYLDHDTGTAIAEWIAEFDDVAQGVRKRMREIAVLEFDGGLISSLREYWASQCVGELSAAAADI